MSDREKLIELQRTNCTADKCQSNCFECMADHLIANGVTVQKWVSVTERLPEDYTERVLVKIKDGNSIIGHPDIDTDRYLPDLSGWVRWGSCVTHWMPLPEPPKEGE